MKNFILQKNKFKDTDQKPDYRLVAKEGDDFVEIGGGWKKQDKNGDVYVSCTLSKTHGEKKGYKIVTEEEEITADGIDF